VEQRSLALGVQSVIWRALGSIPGPIIFGVIFDSSCVYWRGNCWVYNNNHISIRAFFISLTGVLINFVFMLLCWIFYPPVGCCGVSKETDDVQKEKEKEERHITNPVFGSDVKTTAEEY
jgi:hypothetical protein